MGKIKRVGAYEYELEWHQDHSCLIVQKAVEAVLVHGADLSQFVWGHRDIFDFMLRERVPRSNQLMWGDKQVANTIRYYASTDGQPLRKIAPPVKGRKIGDYAQGQKVNDRDYEALNVTGVWDARIHTKKKSVYEQRETDIDKGYVVTLANRITDARWENINYNYYITKAQTLIDGTGING